MSQKPTRWLELSFEELLELAAARHYGAILRYFRRKRAWKAWEVAILYSSALRGEEDEKVVTASWIYMMENKNMVPTDEKRRWILARILEIPPVLLGLKELAEMSVDAHIFTWEHVDIQEYRKTLETYSRGYYLGIALQSFLDIKQRITNLSTDLPYRKGQEKRQICELLCGYLILAAIVVREHQGFEMSIDLLSKAILIAEEEKLYNLWALALRHRGVTYQARGDISGYLHNFAEAQADFKNALDDAQTAQQLAPHLSPRYKGGISVSIGVASARLAQDQQALDQALKSLNAGKGQIGKGDEESFLARFDEELWHLEMANAYLAAPVMALCSPQRARERLEQASLGAKTRQGKNTFLLAKSYLIEGDYPMAASYTTAAIESMHGSISSRHLVSMNYLYQGLLHSPYGMHTDVGELGVKLLKVQKPELFQ